MAFKNTQLKRFVQMHLTTANRMSSVFFHHTEDAAATVATAGYFNDARSRLQVDDTILSKAAIGGTEVFRVFNVTAVPASGNVTVTALDPSP